ncbi:MAG: NUDIX domain-containing protein [Chloroflexi bacterium]|nr:NUDIX domain-containing protein [Chloroflexota bacterium]
MVIRWTDGRLHAALVGRETPERWEIPKGTPLERETIEDAAVREVGEETGLRVRIIEPLDQIAYWFSVRGVRHRKTVYFFLMEAVGGDTANHDWEHDFAEWFPVDEALRRISFPNEVALVQEAAAQARTPPPRAPVPARVRES